MSWEAMVTAEQNVDRIIQDHAAQIGHIETVGFAHTHGHVGNGVMWKDGFRVGVKEGIAWVLHMQTQFTQLPADDQIREFDKGPASLYWPLLKGDDL